MTDREQQGGDAGEQESAHEFLPHDPQSALDAGKARAGEDPLEPWLAELVQDTMQVDETDVPRELMWARIRQQRRAGAATTGERAIATSVVSTPARRSPSPDAPHPRFRGRPILVQMLAVAATLAIGVAIGRFGMPNGAPNAVVVGVGSPQVATSSAAPAAVPGGVMSNEPAVVAMEEHLARTVALLVTVRDESPNAGPGADVSGWARELLGTTRMLLDEPQLRDDRTRRLLQDLELVLVQIIQARGTAPLEAKRAPSATMRETNLLPRVRAVVTASMSTDESTFRGIAE